MKIDTTKDNIVPINKTNPPPTDWSLSKERINDLQQDSIVQLVKRCKQAHFVNVKVRINGQWEEYEADWIKDLVKS